MNANRKCCKCNEPFYANYKGDYYCSFHLEKQLGIEKQEISKKEIIRK